MEKPRLVRARILLISEMDRDNQYPEEEDQVDRRAIPNHHNNNSNSSQESLHHHLQMHANSAAHDKLTHSSSSGSLIITDCGGTTSTDLSSVEGSFDNEKILRKSRGRNGLPHPLPVPTGLKIISLISMVTAIVLIGASGILLMKTHDTLVKWLKAAPTTMELLGKVNELLGGTTGIVEEVESQEKYLKILMGCSAVLVLTGTIQLLCNIWFFCRMNAPCIRRCLVKSEQFFCGI